MTEPLTLAVVNARVWTGDLRRPWAEAVAVAGERVAAVGSSAAIRKQTTASTRVIDAAGAMVTPGFVDAHVHFLPGGFGLASVSLRDARTREEFTRRLAEFAARTPPGRWIRYGDWDHELWGGALPTRDWIDAVTPNHPVWVNRLDGHMALANSRALELAGLSDQAPEVAEVAGGEVVRDTAGRLTGVFKDLAMPLVARAVPAPTPAEEDAALEAAMTYVASHGVTAVHHMGFWEDLPAFARAHENGRLRTRIYSAVPLRTHARLAEHVAEHGRGDSWLRVGLLKAFVDGSLGSLTAAMLEPYTSAPGNRGLLVTDPATLLADMFAAEEAGLQLAIHAIGDRAIREQLDRFATVHDRCGPRDRRWRIEHAQHVHPDDLPRFGELGVVASMQPYHAVDDGRWAAKVVGAEREQQMYPCQSLHAAGAALAFGSDWFVAPPVPLLALDAAVTRRTLDGAHPDGWLPEQRVSLDTALRAHTTGAAHAGFTEGETGRLAPGMLADLVVLDRDPSSVPSEALVNTSVVGTIVGGQLVYEA